MPLPPSILRSIVMSVPLGGDSGLGGRCRAEDGSLVGWFLCGGGSSRRAS